MTSLDTLQESDLKQVFKAGTLKKARGYIFRIDNPVRQGRSLTAEVRGTRRYQVEVEVADGILATCSCPYDWGGYCKHIGAVLLRWIASPGAFEERPSTSSTSDGSGLETFTVEPPATAVPKEKPYWVTFPYSKRVQENDNELRRQLGEYKIQELRQLAENQGWSISGTRKDDIIGQIMKYMLSPSVVLSSLQDLDVEHRRVYQALSLLYRGVAYEEKTVTMVAKRWGTLTQYKKLKTYTRHLCEVGLAMPSSFSGSYLDQIDTIPYSLRRLLPPLLAEQLAAAELPGHEESGVRPAAPRSFLQRLHQVMVMLEQSPPPLRPPMPRPHLEKFYDFLQKWDYAPEEIKAAQAAGKLKGYDPKMGLTVPPPRPALPDEAIERLAPIAGDAVQLEFFYHLLRDASLVQPGSPVTVWREAKEHFLRRDESGQWAVLFDAYLRLDTWSELWLVLAETPSLQLKRSKSSGYRLFSADQLYGLLAVFRLQVLQVLASLADNTWYGLDDVMGLLHTIWQRFDSGAFSQSSFSRDRMPSWVLAEDGRWLDTSSSKADWNKAQGAFIRHIIQGPLHWLGLADISVEYGRLVAFRLHGLHELYFDKAASIPLFGSGEEAAATAVADIRPDKESVVIEENRIVVDPAAMSAQGHNYLDSIALLETAEKTRFVYRLHAAAVHQAFEEGMTLDQLLTQWEKWMSLPMPDGIRRRLTAWWEAYGRVRLYEKVTVIEFDDDYALAEMKATTSLEKHLIAEISPRLVIIPERVVDTLVAELEKAGYTPKQTDDVA